MPDVRLVPVSGPEVVTLDFLQLPSGLLDETEQLASAVMVALNSDALADASEVLPDPRNDDRRGWWGDIDAEQIWGGWPLGSKLWLLIRAKVLGTGAREGATIIRVETYIKIALQPFIDNSFCSSVSVQALQVNDQRIDATIILYRGPKSSIELQFQPLWSEIFPGS
jgi:phage gp46-like protein